MRAFVLALEADGSVGELMNIGSNFEISIGDTARLIAEVMGVEIEIITDHDRLRPEKSEVERLWASNVKARELLGWEPAFSGLAGLRRGLSETIDWFRRPENLEGYKIARYNV